MKTMGITRLRLVLSEQDLNTLNQNRAVICSRAVHAADVYEAATVFPSLHAALADCSLTIATTRRRGQLRKAVSFTPKELAAFLREKAGQAALVFGNERTGLDAESLSLCNGASHIPSSEDFPSLNLSHAVQIYCYELYQALNPQAAQAVSGHWQPLAQAASSEIVHELSDMLKDIGFYKQRGRIEQEQFLLDVISRAGLTMSEAAYLKYIFTKTIRLAQKHIT
ncbi:RNA methyltransferase [Spirochaetia bacterium]|nr:RNA methyltransferase [Spirochaetia bacterium]